MEKLIASIIIKYVLPPLLEALKDAAKEYGPKVVELIRDQIIALLPVLAASTVKAFTDHIPDLKNLPVDVGAVAEKVRENINVSVPGVDIPVLSDLGKRFGFDLTELLGADT